MTEPRTSPAASPPRARWVYLLAAAGGLLAPLSSPPLGLWPLILLALAPLAWAVDRAGRRRDALLAAWLWGALWHGLAFSWVADTLVAMSDLPTPVAWLGVALFGAWQGVAVLLWAAFRRWTGSRGGVWGDAAAAVAWAALELAYPCIFPFPFASCLYRVPLLTQAADLAGLTGLGALLVFANLRLVALAHGWARPRARLRLALAALAPLALLVAYGALRLATLPDEGTRVLRVGWVQPAVLPKEKRARDHATRLASLEREWGEVEKVLGAHPDLLVLPEGSFPYYFQDDQSDRLAFPSAVRQWSQRFLGVPGTSGVPVIFGSLRKVKGWTRNAAFVARPHLPPHIVDKRRLVPFGERIPFGDWFPSLKGAVKGLAHLEPGRGSPRVHVAGLDAHLSICYEAIFPTTIAREAGDADLLVNLTNDEWFGHTAAPEMHLMTQVFRAIETRRPLVRVTNTGVSAWVDAKGRIGARTPIFEVLSGVWQVPITAAFSPFGAAPDAIMAALLLLGAGAAWLTRRRGRPGPAARPAADRPAPARRAARGGDAPRG